MVQCLNGLSELTSFMDIRDDICLLLSERESALGRPWKTQAIRAKIPV